MTLSQKSKEEGTGTSPESLIPLHLILTPPWFPSPPQRPSLVPHLSYSSSTPSLPFFDSLRHLHTYTPLVTHPSSLLFSHSRSISAPPYLVTLLPAPAPPSPRPAPFLNTPLSPDSLPSPSLFLPPPLPPLCLSLLPFLTPSSPPPPYALPSILLSTPLLSTPLQSSPSLPLIAIPLLSPSSPP